VFLNAVERKRKRDRETQGAADTTVLYSYDSAGNIVNADGPASAGPARTGSTGAPRAGRGSSQFRAGAGAGAGAGPQSLAGAGTADIVAALQGDAHLALEGAEPLVDLRTVLPDLDGPDVVCQQPWPSFMETRIPRDYVSVIFSASLMLFCVFTSVFPPFLQKVDGPAVGGGLH